MNEGVYLRESDQTVKRLVQSELAKPVPARESAAHLRASGGDGSGDGARAAAAAAVEAALAGGEGEYAEGAMR